MLRAFFDEGPDVRLRIVPLDADLAVAARELFWDFGIAPKDAVHVATALAAGCDVLMTTDDALLKFSGLVGGSPLLQVTPPAWNA